jgi:hypothetical protein
VTKDGRAYAVTSTYKPKESEVDLTAAITDLSVLRLIFVLMSETLMDKISNAIGGVLVVLWIIALVLSSVSA